MREKQFSLDIIFRSCSRSNLKRYIDAPKSAISLASLRSVVGSLEECPEVTREGTILHVLDDHSDSETVSTIQKILRDAPIKTKFRTLSGMGQSASMAESVAYALKECTDRIYFVEDDYLHVESALSEMLEAQIELEKSMNRHIIISPSDHVVLYFPDQIRPCQVIIGKKRYWRTTTGTTSTYLIDRWLLDTYRHWYELHATYEHNDIVCEANTINRIYEKEYCFSPLPSLAAHITDGNLKQAFFDYERLWKKYKDHSPSI